jgi:hypothetical protein
MGAIPGAGHGPPSSGKQEPTIAWARMGNSRVASLYGNFPAVMPVVMQNDYDLYERFMPSLG